METKFSVVTAQNGPRFPCLMPPISTLAKDSKDGFVWGQDHLTAFVASSRGLLSLGLAAQSGPRHPSHCMSQDFPMCSANCQAFPGDREIPCSSLPGTLSSTKPNLGPASSRKPDLTTPALDPVWGSLPWPAQVTGISGESVWNPSWRAVCVL